MSHQYPVNPRPPGSCGECPFLSLCGGLEGAAFDQGCFQLCVTHCQYHGCDMACPCLHLRFPDLVEDVGGLCSPPQGLLKPCTTPLPLYVSQIMHGARRDKVSEEPIVAVPLTALVGRNQVGRYDVRYSTAESAREALMLAPQTEIIVTSVAPDQPLEDFWAEHVQRDILTKLSALRIRGMTVPNFSFMNDVPRLNSLYNLTRIFRVAERISAAGIPTILHLQASTPSDWNQWIDVLRYQRGMSVVALEFQTGTRRQIIGNRYYLRLIELQDRLGRAIHPLVIGG